MENKEIIPARTPDDVVREIADFTQRIKLDNFTEESFIDMLDEQLLPVEKFFADYSCAIMEIETKFKVLNEQFSLKYDGNPIESIHSRIKDHNSILKKLIKKNLPRTLESIEENISDIAGVRVVCSFVDDIYRLADCLLSQDDIELIDIKDYIKNPKPSGYRSLHLIVRVPIFLENEKKMVKVEVQLRTIAMDFWASLEHKMRYKKNIQPELLEKLSKELTDCADMSASLDSRMQNIRNVLNSSNNQDL